MEGGAAPVWISSHSSPKSTFPGGSGLQQPWQWKCHPQLCSQRGMDGDRERCTPGVAGMGRGTGRAGFGRSPAQLGLCLARRKLWIFSINIPRQTPDGSTTFPLAGETVEKTKDPDWNRLSQDTPSSGDTAGRSQPQLRGQPANKEGLWPLPLRTSSDVPWDGHCELLSLELQGVSRVCRT